MLRFLHSIRSVNPAGGGPIEGVTQIAAVNKAHGHTVEVLSLDSPSDPWVRDCPLKCHALGPGWFRYGYSPRLVPWLLSNRRNYDVVIVNGIWQYSSWGVWRALHNTPTPYFVFTHGMLDPWFKRTYPLKHLKKWLYWPWAEYRVLREATAVLFTCEEERRLARKSFWLYHCDEYVASYGTAAPIGNRELQRELLYERFPVLRDKRCLLFLGRMHVKKAPDLVLKALAVVLNNHPDLRSDIHVIMAGPSESAYGNKIVQLTSKMGLQERVTWTGMLSGDLKWGAFFASDAFILPSHQENFGISVVEALACGLPVLISNQVNIWREIRQHQAGYIESDDLRGVVNLIEKWIDTPRPEWEAMKIRAVACFEHRFRVERMAESLVEAMAIFGLS